MNTLHLLPTSLAQWHALVNQAEQQCQLELGEELESYLVFLLMRFAARPELAASIVAMEFLQALHIRGKKQQHELRDIGDKCLLFAGLFPDLARRRHVNISYFVDVGQSAYAILADGYDQTTLLYANLSEHFLHLSTVLKSFRNLKTTENLLTEKKCYSAPVTLAKQHKYRLN